jgi:hypothetical protein
VPQVQAADSEDFVGVLAVDEEAGVEEDDDVDVDVSFLAALAPPPRLSVR